VRKKGLLFLLILFLIIIAIFLIFTDRWLENRMEAFGSSIVGAKVEFDGVDFSLLSLNMRWKRLQVTNPDDTWRNLFETGNTEFDVDLIPLLSRKFIIENLTLEDFRLNTERTTDGKIEKDKAATTESKIVKTIENQLAAQTKDMPVFNLQRYQKKVNVDSLWRLIDLRTPAKIDSLQKATMNDYQQWEKRIADLPSEKELNAYTERVQALKLDQIDTIEEFQAAYSATTSIYNEIDSIYNSVKTVKTDFQSDVSALKGNQKLIKEWVSRDYQRALSLAKLPDLSVKNVAKILFGERIINQIRRILGYINTTRSYAEKIKTSQPKKESPPRLKGQDIYFSPKQNLPKFWIKQISLSGETNNGMKLAGTVSDIVSRQHVIDKATSINIKGTRQDQAALSLDVTLDYREDKPRELIKIELQEVPLQGVKLSNFPLLPYQIEKGKGKVAANLNFKGSEMVSTVNFVGTHINFDYSQKPTNMDDRLIRISRSIIQSLNIITFDASIKRTEKDFDFRINSNLDKLIADKFKEVVSQEIDNAKREIEDRVQNEIEKFRQEFEKIISQKEQELRKEIEKIEKEIESQKAIITQKKKDIENRINEEKNKYQKQLEDEAKKKLKNLFNKP
jgi:uncharacterized protein (TIGR03545 family)